ncbi:ribonuclease H-like domain-containing protein [Tanacetum coccineum]
MHDPREPHLNAMKRVLRYLQGTTDLGLQLFWSTTSQLITYSDADWAGCPATRRSTSGYCVFLGDNLLTWSSKCQDMLSRSSAEAEYREVANVVDGTSWIRNLLRELHTPLFTATLVYCDNVSVVYMSANPVQHQRTKHIEIDIYFVRDKVAAGHVQVLHVPSRLRYADIFTKGLPYPLFADFRSSLSVCKSPAPTAGACTKLGTHPPNRIVVFGGGHVYMSVYNDVQLLGEAMKERNLACDAISFGGPSANKKELFDTLCDNHDLSRLVKLLALTYVSVARYGVSDYMSLCVFICVYVGIGNQSIECDHLKEIGMVENLVEFLSFTFGDKEIILMI